MAKGEPIAKAWPVVGIAVAGATLATLRIGTSRLDQLYAEDGMFVERWIWAPGPLTLMAPYAGYQHLVPRIGSLLVSILPVAWWGTASTLLASVVVGLVAAATFAAVRPVVSRAAALSLAAVPALAPMAGVEALGNLANIHWWFLYLGFWLCAVDRDRRGQRWWGLAALVAALTEPQTLLLVPWLAWRLWRRRGSLWVAAGILTGLTVQAITFLATPRPRGTGLPDPSALGRGYVANVVLGGLHSNQARLVRLTELAGWWPALLLTALLISFLGVTALRSARQRDLIVALVLVSVLAWSLSFAYNNYEGLTYLTPYPLIRWGTAASMLLTAALVVGADTLKDSRVALAVMAILVATAMLSFPATLSRRSGPGWSVTVAGNPCAGGGATTELEHAPDGWSVKLPCDRLR